MSLRDEIENIATLSAGTTRYIAREIVLASIDRHEAEPPLCDRCSKEIRADNPVRNECAEKPSDERPAREKLWQHNDDTGNGVLLYGLSAIVEAIDSLTAAVKAGKP